MLFVPCMFYSAPFLHNYKISIDFRTFSYSHRKYYWRKLLCVGLISVAFAMAPHNLIERQSFVVLPCQVAIQFCWGFKGNLPFSVFVLQCGSHIQWYQIKLIWTLSPGSLYTVKVESTWLSPPRLLRTTCPCHGKVFNGDGGIGIWRIIRQWRNLTFQHFVHNNMTR